MIIGPEYAGEHLVFVVGCPRSGTTWVQRLLSCSPQVRTGQESNLFVDRIGLQLRRWRRALGLQERGGVGLGCYFTEPELIELLRDFMLKLLQRMMDPLTEGQFFVEKTPDHALYLPEYPLGAAGQPHHPCLARSARCGRFAAGRFAHLG